MDRAYAEGAVSTPPSVPTSPSIGYPRDDGLVTRAGAYLFYMIVEELRNIAALGAVPDYTKVNQCATAIQALITAIPEQNHSWNKAQRAPTASLTYAASITPDLNAANNFQVTLTGNMVINNPSPIPVGQTGFILLRQDSVGTRNLGYGSAFKFVEGIVPSLTQNANALDLLVYATLSTTEIAATLLTNLSRS